jgi:acetyl esterase/lipase
MLSALLFAASLSLGQLKEPSENPKGGDETFPLWAEKVPLAVGDSKFDKPQLTLYKARQPNGAAVVICPGGGYGVLATDHEGKQAAEYFTKLGVHAFVLQYRIVQKERPGPLGKAPLLDAQRAIRMVRGKAKDLAIDPKRVGLMGFSAGGHLASTAGTHFDAGDVNAKDPFDLESCRPDWLVLAYPVVTFEKGVTHGGSVRNLLGDKPTDADIEFFSNEKHVTKDTPPTFIFHTDEDASVLAENPIRFYLALKKVEQEERKKQADAKQPVTFRMRAELHVYERGKHGVGLGTDAVWTGDGPHAKYAADWSDKLTAWLKAGGVLEKK